MTNVEPPNNAFERTLLDKVPKVKRQLGVAQRER